jgi:adhesin transport system outer membrane protein
VQTVRHQASLHEAERWPTVYLRVDHDTGPTPTAYNQPATRTGLYVEANVDGSGLVGYQRIKADAARIAAAEEDVRAASFEVDRRLKMLLNDRELAVQQLQDYDNVVQTQEQSLESALRQYDAGRKNWVDVLNTQRELLDARLARDRARQAADDAQLRVAVMCGTLDPLAGLQ